MLRTCTDLFHFIVNLWYNQNTGRWKDFKLDTEWRGTFSQHQLKVFINRPGKVTRHDPSTYRTSIKTMQYFFDAAVKTFPCSKFQRRQGTIPGTTVVFTPKSDFNLARPLASRSRRCVSNKSRELNFSVLPRSTHSRTHSSFDWIAWKSDKPYLHQLAQASLKRYLQMIKIILISYLFENKNVDSAELDARTIISVGEYVFKL